MRRMPWLAVSALMCAGLAATGCKNKPAAEFTADAVTGTVPLTVQFTDLSTPGSSPITSWHWIFGDGAESMAQHPAHEYAYAGTYNVSLETASADGSDTELKFNYITVTPPDPGDVEIIMLPGDVPLEMVWIPEGTLTMGSTDAELGNESDEEPRHTVSLLNGYWMGKYELTKLQWLAVMGTLPWQGLPFIQTYPESPAVYVSWNDARDFVAALNVLTGKHFALPTEAEWEHACRAGEAGRFYWGEDPAYAQVGDCAWWSGNADSAGQQYAHIAGQKWANAWGLRDMAGNVWEWCEDDWHGSYYGAPGFGYAWMDSPRGANRVVRGGSWVTQGNDLRSANRSGNPFDYKHSTIGFRVVRELGPYGQTPVGKHDSADF